LAIQTLGRVIWPDPYPFGAHGGYANSANLGLDATTTRVAHVTPIDRAGSIVGVTLATSTVTTAATVRVGVYTLDSNGLPTSTAYGGCGTATFTPAANTTYTLTFGTSGTGTRGDVAAIVAEWDSTTGSIVLGGPSTNSSGTWTTPYCVRFTSGSWAKVAGTYMGISAALRYSDGSFGGIACWPSTGGLAITSYNSNTAGADEYALGLITPAAIRVAGISPILATSADYEAILYGPTGALATLSVAGAQANSGGGASARYLMFASPVTVPANTLIRAAIRPTTTTNISLRRIPVWSGGNGLWGLPADARESTRVDQGTWSDVQTSLPLIGLILDGADDGASTGGLILPRAMHGGYTA